MTLELSKEWFKINQEQNDLENVLAFIENLPINFQQILDEQKSNFIETKIEKNVIDNIDKKYS